MALKTLLAFVLVPAALAAPATLKRTFTPEPDTIPWSVRGLTRTCGSNNECSYVFKVDQYQDPFQTTCSIAPAVASNQPWYGLQCAETKAFVVSWGYDASADSAVMSVIDEDQQELAWFGFDGVNSKTQFADVGPSTVYACNGGC